MNAGQSSSQHEFVPAGRMSRNKKAVLSVGLTVVVGLALAGPSHGQTAPDLGPRVVCGRFSSTVVIGQLHLVAGPFSVGILPAESSDSRPILVAVCAGTGSCHRGRFQPKSTRQPGANVVRKDVMGVSPHDGTRAYAVLCLSDVWRTVELATDLEAIPRDVGNRLLADTGWTPGKHDADAAE